MLYSTNWDQIKINHISSIDCIIGMTLGFHLAWSRKLSMFGHIDCTIYLLQIIYLLQFQPFTFYKSYQK